uniref:C2 domain-containing protein n=1 Tax=Heterorhabditis bacteriophora TaxID=37862 RepID=A0A1I7XNX1_HETBA
MSKWKFSKYTDFFGGIIDKKTMNNPGKDWQYEGKWKPDMHHNYGDKSGWIYAISDVFWGASGIYDKEQRAAHKFRRRCITRRRKAINYKNENFESYVESLGDAQWEYSTGWGKAYHYQQQNSDTLRRRRFVVEVEREKKLPKDRKHEMFFLPRLFEVHQVISTWQLRCYFLWAKNLLPIVKNSSRAFVRVIFLTKVKESLVVDNSQNPIWNETIIFDKMLIPGGKRQIALNPPTILLEVRGEKENASEVNLFFLFINQSNEYNLVQTYEFIDLGTLANTLFYLKGARPFGLVFLGRVESMPVVICTPNDSRAKPQWHTLKFKNENTRGALLACFELFYADDYNKDELPLVSLPKDLELSPPLVINLFDSRAFKRKPLVGVCHITSFNRYIRTPISTEKSEPDSDWSKYDKALEAEEIALKTWPSAPSLEREGMPHLDWWSKYYASLGEASKAPGFEEYSPTSCILLFSCSYLTFLLSRSGIEHLKIFDHELEEENNYNGFEDFLETFTFVRSTKLEYKSKHSNVKYSPSSVDDLDLVDLPAVEFFGPVQCLIRVYVIEARGLQAQSPSGICDPYLTVKCGKQKVTYLICYKIDYIYIYVYRKLF